MKRQFNGSKKWFTKQRKKLYMEQLKMEQLKMIEGDTVEDELTESGKIWERTRKLLPSLNNGCDWKYKELN